MCVAGLSQDKSEEEACQEKMIRFSHGYPMVQFLSHCATDESNTRIHRSLLQDCRLLYKKVSPCCCRWRGMPTRAVRRTGRTGRYAKGWVVFSVGAAVTVVVVGYVFIWTCIWLQYLSQRFLFLVSRRNC